MAETVIFTNMCMICDGNKVVVMERLKQDWPGINFPGGHVEEGESFTDAVIREVKEETGLTIFSPRLCGIKDWYDNNERYVVYLFKTSHFEGELISSDEGKVWWEELEQLSKLSLSLDMEDIIRVITEKTLSEFFYRKDGQDWVYDLK